MLHKKIAISPCVIRVNSISKEFGNRKVLNNISFTGNYGDIILICGPNGAGKSTLLYVMSGLIQQTSGSVFWFNSRLIDNRENILNQINYASSASFLNGYATPNENLFMYGNLYGVANVKTEIKKLFHFFELPDHIVYKKKMFTLSQGENTKVLLCKSLINKPRLLLLDEITAPLDISSKKKLLSVIKGYKKRKSGCVCISTHDISSILPIATKLVVLKRGCVAYCGKPLTLKKIKRLYE